MTVVIVAVVSDTNVGVEICGSVDDAVVGTVDVGVDTGTVAFGAVENVAKENDVLDFDGDGVK